MSDEARQLPAPPPDGPSGRTGTVVRRLRLLAGLAWGALVVAYLIALLRGGSPGDLVFGALTFLQDHPAGPVLFTVMYALRPLLFGSAALLTIGAGALWGLAIGIPVVVVGANAGAMLAYALGRSFGADLAGRAVDGPRLRGAAARLRANAFDAVLTMRLTFVPFDAVSYLAGAVRLAPRAFLVATVVGSIPGTLFLLLFGAGFADVAALARDGAPAAWSALDLRLLLLSAAVLVVSLTASRLWRRRERARVRV